MFSATPLLPFSSRFSDGWNRRIVHGRIITKASFHDFGKSWLGCYPSRSPLLWSSKGIFVVKALLCNLFREHEILVRRKLPTWW